MRSWAGNVRHGLSANQVNLKNCMRFHVDFFHVVRYLLKLQIYHAISGYEPKILLASKFAGFSTFDLFDLLILNWGSIGTLYLSG